MSLLSAHTHSFIPHFFIPNSFIPHLFIPHSFIPHSFINPSLHPSFCSSIMLSQSTHTYSFIPHSFIPHSFIILHSIHPFAPLSLMLSQSLTLTPSSLIPSSLTPSIFSFFCRVITVCSHSLFHPSLHPSFRSSVVSSLCAHTHSFIPHSIHLFVLLSCHHCVLTLTLSSLTPSIFLFFCRVITVCSHSLFHPSLHPSFRSSVVSSLCAHSHTHSFIPHSTHPFAPLSVKGPAKSKTQAGLKRQRIRTCANVFSAASFGWSFKCNDICSFNIEHKYFFVFEFQVPVECHC